MPRVLAVFSFAIQVYLMWAPEKHKDDLRYTSIISMAYAAYWKLEEEK